MANWAWGQNFVNAIMGIAGSGPVGPNNPLPVTPVGSGGGTQEVQGNVAAGATDSGNPVKTGGVYTTPAPTLTNGQRGNTQLDVNGNTLTSMGTLISGESQTLNRLLTAGSYNMGTAAAVATTTIKSGAGVMAGFMIPTLVAGGTVKIYDNTAASGTVLLDTYTLPAVVTPGMGPNFIPWPVAFATGLTVVTTGTAMVVDVLYL